MKTNNTINGFNKSKKMFQFKKINLENEFTNFIKNKINSKNIHFIHKREKTLSNNINDVINEQILKTSTYNKRNLSYNYIPSYREIKAIDKYSSPHYIIDPSIKRIITIPKYKQNYKNKSLTLVSKSIKNKLKKIQTITSSNLNYNNISSRKYLSIWNQIHFKKNIIINNNTEKKISKNQYNLKTNQKYQKFLNNRELKLLNNPDSIFYQIFNQVKSKVNKYNPIFQKPEDKLKEYYEDIKKNEEEAIKELYLLKLQFILSDQEKMIGKINSTNTFMDIKVKQLEG